MGQFRLNTHHDKVVMHICLCPRDEKAALNVVLIAMLEQILAVLPEHVCTDHGHQNSKACSLVTIKLTARPTAPVCTMAGDGDNNDNDNNDDSNHSDSSNGHHCEDPWYSNPGSDPWTKPSARKDTGNCTPPRKQPRTWHYHNRRCSWQPKQQESIEPSTKMDLKMPLVPAFPFGVVNEDDKVIETFLSSLDCQSRITKYVAHLTKRAALAAERRHDRRLLHDMLFNLLRKSSQRPFDRLIPVPNRLTWDAEGHLEYYYSDNEWPEFDDAFWQSSDEDD